MHYEIHWKSKLCTHAYTQSTHIIFIVTHAHTDTNAISYCLVLLFHISKLNPQHAHCSHRIQANTHSRTLMHIRTHAHKHMPVSIHINVVVRRRYSIKLWTPTALTSKRETRRQKGESIELNCIVRRISNCLVYRKLATFLFSFYFISFHSILFNILFVFRFCLFGFAFFFWLSFIVNINLV